MFVVAAITLCLVIVGIGAFIYGTVQLAKFAFRVSTGRGVAAILFPPYTFYFAFAELEEEEKAIPTASWMFGLVVTVLLTAIFAQPLQLLLSGEFDKLTATNPGEAARSEYGTTTEESETEETDEETGAETEDSEASEETSETTSDEPDAGDDSATDAAETDAGPEETDSEDDSS